MTERQCCVCGCTDITACRERDGSPCCWVNDELCSACEEVIIDDVVIQVGEERRRQDLRWGGPESDDRNSYDDWDRHIRRLHDETLRARLRNDPAEYRRTMIQVAALAVAAVQAHDRKMEGA